MILFIIFLASLYLSVLVLKKILEDDEKKRMIVWGLH